MTDEYIYIHIPLNFQKMFKYCYKAIASTQALPAVLIPQIKYLVKQKI